MARFNFQDVLILGDTRARPSELYARLGAVFTGSSDVRADVEYLSASTGEYCVVIRGALEYQPPDGTAPAPGDEGPAELEDEILGAIEPLPADEPQGTEH